MTVTAYRQRPLPDAGERQGMAEISPHSPTGALHVMSLMTDLDERAWRGR
ncbi:hypothetical protein [Streptomyces eurythermus]